MQVLRNGSVRTYLHLRWRALESLTQAGARTSVALLLPMLTIAPRHPVLGHQVRSISPVYDFGFQPEGYGRDPLTEVFSVIEEDTARATVWRLLREERIEEMETALRWAGILEPEGAFNQEKHPNIEWRTSNEIEGEEVSIADLSSRDYYNWVGAVRVGWYWEIIGHFDGIRSPLGRSTVPISMKSLIAILDDTGLVDHFREAGEEDVVWDSAVYPQLEAYYLSEAERWARELAEELADEDNE